MQLPSGPLMTSAFQMNPPVMSQFQMNPPMTSPFQANPPMSSPFQMTPPPPPHSERSEAVGSDRRDESVMGPPPKSGKTTIISENGIYLVQEKIICILRVKWIYQNVLACPVLL
jgi:hypothetical protein